MNSVEKVLNNTRKTLREACEEAGVDFSTTWLEKIDTCSSCSLWLRTERLIPDLDGLLVCKDCYTFYGA